MASEVVLDGLPPDSQRLAAPVGAIAVGRDVHAMSIVRPARSIEPKLAIAMFALCAAVVLGGCGSGSPTVASPTTTTPAATATTRPNSPAAMALSAYRAMWADMVIASRTSDYKSPLLPQHASGAALSLLVQGLAKNQQLQIVTKGHPTSNPQVTSLSPTNAPTQATVSDCFNATNWLEYKTGGELFNKTPGGRHATTAIVMATGGVWKVTQLAVRASGTC
jgi:hypothetical protein